MSRQPSSIGSIDLDPVLNAFVTVIADEALAAARDAERLYARAGPRPALCGVPLSIKDVVPTAGVRTTMGSRLFADWIPDADAPLVERLRDAGAVLLGKTTVPEFGWKGDSGNYVNGPARNPFDPARTAGGSSGGAAAAVACGMGPLAQGGDGAGSIRIPAAFCGVVGLKPSHGRVPYAPAGALELLVSEGPIARTVADSALMLDVLAGPDPRDRLSLDRPGRRFADAVELGVRGMRIGWSADLGCARVDPAVAQVAAGAVQRAVRARRAVARGRARASETPGQDLELLFATAYAGLHLDGYGPTYQGDAERARELLDPGLRELIESGEARTAAELTAAAPPAAPLLRRGPRADGDHRSPA